VAEREVSDMGLFQERSGPEPERKTIIPLGGTESSDLASSTGELGTNLLADCGRSSARRPGPRWIVSNSSGTSWRAVPPAKRPYASP